MAQVETLVLLQLESQKQMVRCWASYIKLAKPRRTAVAIQSRLDDLRLAWEECRQRHFKIIELADDKFKDTHRYFVEDSFSAIQDNMEEARDNLSDALELVEHDHKSSSTASGEPACAKTGGSDLPRINVPKFNGDIRQWAAFKDMFESLIDIRTDLTDTQKLHHLKNSMVDSAAQVLSATKISGANYKSAWEALQKRFDRKRAIVYAHFQALMDIPSVGSNHNADLKHLLDAGSEIRSALLNLSRPVDEWADLFLFILLSKFDQGTRREWELSLGDRNVFPEWSTLEEFLLARIGASDELAPCDASRPQPASKPKLKVKAHIAAPTDNHFIPRMLEPTYRTVVADSCTCEGGSHSLPQCPSFLNRTSTQRYELVKKLGYCVNCLSSSHRGWNCASKSSCRRCQKRHHTLLHFTGNDTRRSGQSSSRPDASTVDHDKSESPSGVVASNLSASVTCRTILPTALVLLRGGNGRTARVRALIDQGSQATFVSQSIIQILRPILEPVTVTITGIGSANAGAVRHLATLSVEPCSGGGPSVTVTALVLPRLSTYTPPVLTNMCDFKHLAALTLADPDPFSLAPIDLIIGSDYYGQIICNGLIRGSPTTPAAQRTIFGWILSGPSQTCSPPDHSINANHITVDLNKPLQETLAQFWTVEEVPARESVTAEERQCEMHFLKNYSRLASGRFVVRLPFNSPTPIPIGNTYGAARRVLLSNESRLAKKPALLSEYNAFLSEYERLGHMVKVPSGEVVKPHAVYLPHHAVLKMHSTTTRLRVVFNASAPSSNTKTLNDFLFVGPKLQTDLFALILRWRSYRFVYTSDIEKMFRQIVVHQDDVDYQRILWRDNQSEPISTFRLLTVTYGTAPAPFLANRVIHQLVVEEGNKYPLAAQVLQSEIYVDDIMFGGDDLDHLNEIRRQLTLLLMAGGFRPYKWAANHPSLLSEIPAADLSNSCAKILGEEQPLKVLGIVWDPILDCFSFNIYIEASYSYITKRSFLSLLAKVFDPLGWVAPVIIKGKILMQLLWLRKLGWDDTLPSDLSKSCTNFRDQLGSLNRVLLPRWIGNSGSVDRMELHGFADASNSAYAAVVYIRSTDLTGNVKVSLVYAKTKVAPLKLLSIPRLELCAAVLLVRAIEYVVSSMHLESVPITCWSDSAVVLAWLDSSAARWKTFVAHRVARIQASFPRSLWRHVRSADNPADCASRGITAETLLDHTLWWSGPPWLSMASPAWPSGDLASDTDTEAEMCEKACVHAGVIEPLEDLTLRFSSVDRALRVIAYAFRFVNKLRHRDVPRSPFLTAAEIEKARLFCCKRAQTTLFPESLASVTPKKLASLLKPFSALSPFVDDEGIIRVGGRLRHSELPISTINPILLPKCHWADLIVRHAHLCTLHGGVTVTLRFIRERYWILRARSTVKKFVFSCVQCTRQRADVVTQTMGVLPPARINPSRPFTHTGIDYAGPFLIRSSKGRGVKSHKAYCVLFVCLKVRAIHIEVADDYSTPGFLAAFHRFVSRRGMPRALYSDNAANFTGADRELRRCLRNILSDPDLQARFATDGVEWNFIPPASPHFGGLWEAGVKSVKFHLKRIIGQFTPTYEEFYTLLCKIECVLNSRPICPMFDDAESIEALTPGHFLTGTLLKSVPVPSVLDLNENRLSRWQTVQAMQERFWRIWSSDYLNSLQQRVKWRSSQGNLKVGDLVLLRAPNLPPSKWELGRILKCFPGTDNLVRVVQVKTAHSQFRRPVTQLCRLPVPHC